MTDEDKRLYNKAVEALDQMGAGLPSEIDKYVPAWIDGYKKGLKTKINITTISDCPIKNEWHKVADGDLPKQDDVYLLYTTKGFLLGHYEQGGSDGKVDFCGESYSDFTEYPSEEEFMENEVIAWCEIPQYTEDKE